MKNEQDKTVERVLFFVFSGPQYNVITTVLIWTRVFLTGSGDNGPMARAAGHSVCGMGARDRSSQTHHKDHRLYFISPSCLVDSS